VGDSVDNKSDSIQKNFDLIRFTGSGVMAKRQKKGGQLPTLNFWLLKNCQEIFCHKMLVKKMQNLDPKTSI